MVERPSKTFRRVRKLREEEFIPSGEPGKSYKRMFKKTRMSWPLALIYFKRGDVLAVILLFYAGIIIALCIVGYFALQWVLWQFFGVVI